MKLSIYDVVIGPVFTEKATFLKDEMNQYVIKVHPKAKKRQIKEAIEKIFKVNVKKIQVINVKGKPKRLGRYEGRRSNWKKAIITLQENQTIPFFEGV